MSLLVLAFPDLQKEDFDAIQSFRKEHDELYNIVDPHFTIVFPVIDVSTDDFVAEIKGKANVFQSFNIVIREAMVHKDEMVDQYLAFLVPDVGYNNLVGLHGKLHSERLKNNLRTDIPYIPHITIGKTRKRIHCMQMADKWNSNNRLIHGKVNKLTMVNYENNCVKKLHEIMLQQD